MRHCNEKKRFPRITKNDRHAKKISNNVYIGYGFSLPYTAKTLSPQDTQLISSPSITRINKCTPERRQPRAQPKILNIPGAIKSFSPTEQQLG